MKIKIDRDLCEANGVCIDYAPDVFSLDNDDILLVDEAELTQARRKQIEAAVKFCPRGALLLED